MMRSISLAPTVARVVGGVLCALLATGCVGTQKRFEQGTELESKGRWVEAAKRYIQVLRKEPGREDARLRLEEVGPRAVEVLLNDANRDEPVRAAERLKDLDRLADDAWSVGVQLPLPQAYDSLRAASFRRAMEDLMRQGRAAELRGAWADAINAYDRVKAFEPESEAFAAADEAAVGALLRWGSADLEAGRYLSAMARVDDVLARLSGADAQDRPEIGLALALRDETIARGTVYVAFTPIVRGDSDSDRAPRDFLDELNDVLDDEAWSRPPVLVAVTDPSEVRRELRRGNWDREGLTVREAARFGREMNVDLVAIGTVSRYTAEERDLKTTIRRVKTTRGQDTTYVEVTGRLHIEVEIEIRLIETRARRVVDRLVVRDNESGRFERGEYAGDIRDLRLSREERRLFDEDRIREQSWAVQESLIRRVSDRIARGMFEDVHGFLR